MRLVSPLLKHALYPALHHSGWLKGMMPAAGFAVVNYHGVIPADHARDPAGQDSFLDANLTRPDEFRKQLRFLKDRYHVIHPEDFRAYVEQGSPLPARAVLLTCDDGLLNAFTDLLPVLQSEKVSCLFFVTSASCADQPGMLWYEELYRCMRSKALTDEDLQLPGNGATRPAAAEAFQGRWWSAVQRASRLDANERRRWLAQLRQRCHPMPNLGSEKRWRLLNATELRQLAAAEVSIGAHTRFLPILSLCGEEQARREIYESKIEIERALGRPVWAFAYPFGNPSTMESGKFAWLAKPAITAPF
jgi:peptidoglycan/xylan/chitin deacetylase (PgdA/CDA1 family)